MTDTDPLIYPGMPPFEGPTCPHCGRTGHNRCLQYHYEPDPSRLPEIFHKPVQDGEICDRCGMLVPCT